MEFDVRAVRSAKPQKRKVRMRRLLRASGIHNHSSNIVFRGQMSQGTLDAGRTDRGYSSGRWKHVVVQEDDSDA
jgi:hypothetical protein